MVRIDPSAPITPVNDVIPDDVDTPYAINGGGSAKICRQLLGNLRDIEANPGDKNLQAEFLARRDLLRDRMSATDQAMVDGEHARVRELIKPKKRAAPRKPVLCAHRIGLLHRNRPALATAAVGS